MKPKVNQDISEAALYFSSNYKGQVRIEGC